MQGAKRHEDYEHVDVSAVEVTPESNQGDHQPDIQDVSICGENKNQQEYGKGWVFPSRGLLTWAEKTTGGVRQAKQGRADLIQKCFIG